MLSRLPANTDFYSATPRPHVGVKLPDPARAFDFLSPAPRMISVRRDHNIKPQLSRLREDVIVPGSELDRELARLGVAVPEQLEGYSIAPVGDALCLASRSRLGIQRGHATLDQLRRVGQLQGELPALHVVDYPSTPTRFLGGWAFWRAHGLADAIAIAHAFKANRVLYNGWGWIPGREELQREDEILVTRARERGIELVFELRRMSFGKEYRISESSSRRRIVEAYERAVDAGFRSFGLLFDDVPWETADDECALVCDVLAALEHRAATSPGAVELFVCPQIYWYPGQMNATWTGHADDEETRRQRQYLRTYGKHLPPGVQVYIANFWGDHPDEYSGTLAREFTELVGRKPIFFDNQVINDYRHGAVFPFALQARPQSFANDYAGYYLNCGRPFAAYAPTAATALAYAWNPATYEAEHALGCALAWFHGPLGQRPGVVAGGIDRLRSLANAWGGGVYTAVSHYATLWRQVQAGEVTTAQLLEWTDELEALARIWTEALATPTANEHPLSIDSLLALWRDNQRLQGDLGLFASHFRAPGDERVASQLDAELERQTQLVLRTVGSILPPAPGLECLLENPEALKPLEAPAWSWVEYFHRNTRRTLSELAVEMRAWRLRSTRG